MNWTDDPAEDYDRYDAEMREMMKEFPECEICHGSITEDSYFSIDGLDFHKECFESTYTKYQEEI